MLPRDVLGITCIFNPWIKYTGKIEHIKLGIYPSLSLERNKVL